jgi:phage terminase small subunit
MSRELTDKQKQFCVEYIKDCNATQAVIRAGYSAKGASVTASNLLINIRVAKTIRELLDKSQELTIISKNWVTAELQEIYKDMRQGDNKTNVRAATAGLKALEQMCKLLGYNSEEDVASKVITAIQINVKEPIKDE